MRAPWLLTFVLVHLALTTRPVHAHDAKRFALNWVRGPGAEACISSHRLAQQLQQTFGPVLVTADEAELAIEGQVDVAKGDGSEGAPTWHARVAVSDRQGRLLGVRELSVRNATCSALDPQVLLVIAMTIDPEVALESLPPELLAELGAPDDAAAALLAELRTEHAAQRPPVQAPPVEHHRAPLEPEPAAPRGSDEPSAPGLGFGMFAHGAFTTGLLPEARPGLALGLELRVAPRWALRAVGLWSATSTRAIESPFLRSASVRFDASLVSLAACASPLVTRALRASACLGAALLLRASEARGLERAPDSSAQTLAPQLEGVLEYTALPPFALTLAAGLHAPLQRVSFSYSLAGASARQPLYESSPVAVSALIGAGLAL